MTRDILTLRSSFTLLALAACQVDPAVDGVERAGPMPMVDEEGEVARGPARISDALTLGQATSIAAALEQDLARVEALEAALAHDPEALFEAVEALEEARLASLEGMLDDSLVDQPTAGDLALLRARFDLAPVEGGPAIDDGAEVPVPDPEGLPLDAPPWTTLGLSTWGSSTVTWCFQDDEDGTSDIDDAEVLFSASFASAQWGANSGLYFERRTDCGSANIRVGFHTGYHWDWDWAGDTSSFDSRGGTLAHAFAPTYGYLHFDDAETWTRSTRTTTAQPLDLDAVMTHEWGHTLGLGHSTTSTATMWPTYPGSSARTLDSDDIAGVSSLYGARTSNCTNTYLQAYYAKTQAYTLYSHVYADHVAGDASYTDYDDAYHAYLYASYAFSYARSAVGGDLSYGDSAGWALSLAVPYLEDVGVSSFDYAASDNWGSDNLARALKAHYYANAGVITGAACTDGR